MTDSELLQQLASEVAENTKQTALLHQAIMGNGVKGLCQRVEEVESYIKSHPSVCPFSAAPNPRRVNATNVIFAVIGAVGVIGSLVVAVVK